MTIAIDLTSLSYHVTGMERYAMCVTEQMLKIDEKNDYILIFRDSVYPVFQDKVDGERVQNVVLRGNNKIIFNQWTLMMCLYRIKADRYLFFAFTSPVLFRKRGIYNTIHDMGAWDAAKAMKFLQKLYWRTTIRCSAKASEGLVTVSRFSKDRIASILNYPQDKIRVIYSAVFSDLMKEQNITFDEVKKEYNLPDKYILTLSTLEPRKNLGILLEAYSEIKDRVDYELVLVGRKGWMMEEILKKYGSESRIHVTGFVKDEHISVIYKNALCFVYPSLYEGFGMPPVEALASGIPVIASDAASLPEILMDRAVYFRNNSKKELKNLLMKNTDEFGKLPHSLNKFQSENYDFHISAGKLLEFIGHGV